MTPGFGAVRLSRMTPDQAMTLLHFLMPQVTEEAQTTRRVIAAIPADKQDYKPAEKNMSAIELAKHLAISDVWFLESILKASFVWDAGADAAPEMKNPADVVAFYDAALPPLVEKVNALSPEFLTQTVDFFGMVQMPLVGYLQFLIKHAVHHRGQLAAYLRPMGGKVPSIYGGSADEPMTAEAAS